jgi:hypothetical protein
MLLKNREFHKNWYSESHTLPRVVIKSALFWLHFLQVGQNSAQEVSEKIFLTACAFCFGAVTLILYLEAKMYVNTIIPYLLSDLCEIRYKSSAHNVPEHLGSP